MMDNETERLKERGQVFNLDPIIIDLQDQVLKIRQQTITDQRKALEALWQIEKTMITVLKNIMADPSEPGVHFLKKYISGHQDEKLLSILRHADTLDEFIEKVNSDDG